MTASIFPADVPAAILENNLLSDLSEIWKAQFLSNCELRTAKKREVLLAQGSLTPGLIMIASGEIEISAQDDSGHVMVLHCSGPGEVLGDVESLAYMPALATCTAMPGCEVAIIPPERVMESLATPIFARNFARISYSRMAFINRTHSQNKYLPVEARICSCLMTLSRHSPIIRRPQAYVAEMAGCSRQTVNRCLGALRDDGIVALRKGIIEVLDNAKLSSRWS